MTTVEVVTGERLVGRLVVGDGLRPVVEFTYDRGWLSAGYPIDPELPLSAAPFVRGDSLFGAFADAGPDSWGRGLLARSHPDRLLSEADYLLMVDDTARQGALRFRDAEGRWCSDRSPVPYVDDLDVLRRAAHAAEEERGEPPRVIVAAGGGTGGARPKAVLRDDGALWIAKFGSRHDTIETEEAEHAVAVLGRRAGLTMSETRLVHDLAEPVLLSRRFDRTGTERHAFLSARTLLRAVVDPGRETFDYLELADVLPELSARPTADLRELWRRVAFGCLVQNTDDHMRNHAFVRVGDGWRLSPAFDVNTDPGLGLTSATSVDGEAGPGKLEALVRSADYFRLTEPAARTLLAELAEAVASSLDGVLASFASTRTAERLREIISARVGEAR